ncbi:MAG: FAD-dependent oxidoreductase [Gammaproteobacteria bacterium]|nr:FAD-dependent oxidoreductase [Gammaproteobacteria bacterium]MBL6999278.1 FAD-dependent oxidoreductase [Gammaproteobacteria bacterium]
MQNDRYDIVVIGAGINGVGVAQAAAAMGYRCLLLEKNAQPGLETSSRSSKLIHGGLRYLESFEWSLVRESLQERELLLKLAPELVTLQTFNIPVYSGTSRSRVALHTGLSLYALLSGLQPHSLYHRLKPAYWDRLEGLTTQNLKAVFQYQDAQTDDQALTRAVLASAISLGAEYQCNAEMLQATMLDQQLIIRYRQNHTEKEISSRVMVNASGPWVYSLNQRISPQSQMQQPELVQGAHLVLNASIQQAFYMEATQDRRAVFLLPWKGKALLGTTENSYHGNPSTVTVLEQEKNYLLNIYRQYFPGRDTQIIAEMAGLRVLPASAKAAFKRSRDIVLETDRRYQPRVISMLGGKLTVYRTTALKVMQLLQPSLPASKAIADTAQLTISPVDSL